MGTSRVTVNVVPSPSLLWHSISPPMRSTICLVMARPSPVPCTLFTRLSVWRENDSYMCSMNSSLMPMPVSTTR